MSAITHTMGGDLSLNSAGGLATVSGADQTTQGVLHRLCTNEGDYIWELTYGAGLPAQIGQPANLANIQAIVSQQMALEASVDQTQPVTVALSQVANGTYKAVITYTDLATQTARAVSLSR
ncbi:hypothetical protein [Tanticharoenia sakaeratensis]|uniref:Phage tail protein n=1 Tax=Tanticharoenia sakaeratensis NBRC 103193 TaxID=1231623 RepID=A0A0D6MPC2_9PROT|nr:hypothetical protein [Tanticharoenia sakaeratensis]GAN55276.1 hypothetical protein Tasa_041_071 [Tanticharoenia sakaeratensis NBRC 103193]GBQ23424.1 phage tail protein [Tanticharoenia sakaeratensis NBRC 103193]